MEWFLKQMTIIVVSLNLQFEILIRAFHHQRGAHQSSRLSRRMVVLVTMWKHIMWTQTSIKVIIHNNLSLNRLRSYHPKFRIPNQFLRRCELQASLRTYWIWTQMSIRVMGCRFLKPKVIRIQSLYHLPSKLLVLLQVLRYHHLIHLFRLLYCNPLLHLLFITS